MQVSDGIKEDIFFYYVAPMRFKTYTFIKSFWQFVNDKKKKTVFPFAHPNEIVYIHQKIGLEKVFSRLYLISPVKYIQIIFRTWMAQENEYLKY